MNLFEPEKRAFAGSQSFIKEYASDFLFKGEEVFYISGELYKSEKI